MVVMSGGKFGRRVRAGEATQPGADSAQDPAKPAGDPLDGMWLLKVAEKLYGPYSGHQMCRFKTEGRLSAHSMISRMGKTPVEAHWHTAASDNVLGHLFRTPSPNAPGFGQRTEATGSRFVIALDIKGGHSRQLEQEIFNLGNALRVTPLLWLVTGPHTVNSIRNQLSQYLGPLDWMLVIDASQGRTGGFNMGPEIDSQIRAIWQT